MLSDYQTRQLEQLNARLTRLAEAIEIGNAESATNRTPDDWSLLFRQVRRLEGLSNANKVFSQAILNHEIDTSFVEPSLPPIRRLVSKELRELLEILHRIDGTPVDGYVAEDL